MKSRLPVIAVTVVVILCLTLSLWQVQRLVEKEGMIRQLETHLTEPPLTVLPTTEGDNEAALISSYAYHPVSLRGYFLPSYTIRVGLRYHHLKPGHLLLTPFLTDQGAIVLVNRGWVPAAEWFPDVQVIDVSDTPLTLSGVLVPPEASRPFSPANVPEEGFWFWIDRDRIASFMEMQLYPLLVQQQYTAVPEVYPEPWPVSVSIRNDHLYYAITWFMLAVVVGGMFLIWRRKFSS